MRAAAGQPGALPAPGLTSVPSPVQRRILERLADGERLTPGTLHMSTVRALTKRGWVRLAATGQLILVIPANAVRGGAGLAGGRADLAPVPA